MSYPREACQYGRGIELSEDGNAALRLAHSFSRKRFLGLVQTGAFDTRFLDFIVLHGDFEDATLEPLLGMVNDFLLIMAPHTRAALDAPPGSRMR
jgi:hypothetical protein